MSLATTEAIWLKGPVTIYEDNCGCIGMATNMESKRAKHIDIKHHFVRDSVANGKIKITHIGTKNQLADIFTKTTDVNRFHELTLNLGLSD